MGSETLTDFALFVWADADPALIDSKLTPSDIHFMDANRAPLASDVELLDVETGTISAWVRLPELPPEPGTQLIVQYGGEAPAMTTATFPPEAFRAAWHLGDSPDDVIFPDSGANMLHGLGDAMGSPDRMLSPLGTSYGAEFQDGHTVQVADPNGALDFGEDSFSISLWVRVDASVDDFDAPFFKGGFAAVQSGVVIALGAGEWWAGLADGSTAIRVQFGLESDYLGGMTHLALVVDRTTQMARTFVNGVEWDAASIAGMGGFGSSRDLEWSRIGFDPFAGFVDEIRVHARAVSSAWLQAEHANMRTPDSFYTIEPVD